MLIEETAFSLMGVVAVLSGTMKESEDFAALEGLAVLKLDGVPLGTPVEQMSCFFDLSRMFGLATGFFGGYDSTCVCG
jgi:hypothetical protein